MRGWISGRSEAGLRTSDFGPQTSDLGLRVQTRPMPRAVDFASKYSWDRRGGRRPIFSRFRLEDYFLDAPSPPPHLWNAASRLGSAKRGIKILMSKNLEVKILIT